jgi:molybdenum cofactor cytidylyltransferase
MKPETPRIAGLLLAAGPSSRLGQAKQLVKVGEESLIRRATRLLLAQQLDSVTVVVGSEAATISREIQDLPVTIISNPEWARGMGASISCGVRRISPPFDGILLMACDQWRLEEADLAQLIAAWTTDISGISVAGWREGKAIVSGPPVIFPRKLKPDLISVNKSRGARQVIDRNIDLVHYVEMENAACDLDRPEDLEELINRP